MKKSSRSISIVALFVVACLCLFGWFATTDDMAATAAEANSAEISPQPVDDSMHHFMEYIFEPNYKQLKAAMADAPADKSTWKVIKANSLTMAECANLLLMRAPDEDANDWRKLAATVRARGAELYQAARKSDYAAARKAYGTMLESCNACHEQFAGGEHQLKP